MSIHSFRAFREKRGKPTAIRAAPEDVVELGASPSGARLPLMVRPTAGAVDLASWAQAAKPFIEQHLSRAGAILFRGFDPIPEPEFDGAARAILDRTIESLEESSPRTRVSGKVYTSTEYPSEEEIFPHNEGSYLRTYPLKLVFLCVMPPREGGHTPLTDCRKVFERIDPAIRERFREKKYRYVRNYGTGFGVSWEKAFHTASRRVVEDYCRAADVRYEWRPGNRLRTWQIRDAIATHPRTGEAVWFNHATFFHVSTLRRPVRDKLLEAFDEEDLPHNTYYGDGSAIEAEVLEQLRSAYRQETAAFPWQSGDVLLIDNVLVAHSRSPFVGERRVLVAMGPPSRDA